MSSSTDLRRTWQRGRVDSDDPETPRGTPPQTRLANIPAEVFQESCEALGNIIRPEYDNSRIQRSLGHVWMAIRIALEKDPKLEGHLADIKEFLANVKRKGEPKFIDSLKDMAESGIWAGLFEDGMFSSFDPKHFDYDLISI